MVKMLVTAGGHHGRRGRGVRVARAGGAGGAGVPVPPPARLPAAARPPAGAALRRHQPRARLGLGPPRRRSGHVVGNIYPRDKYRSVIWNPIHALVVNSQ